MTSNHEQNQKDNFKDIHILIAVRRKKENRELKEICHRVAVTNNYKSHIAELKAKTSEQPGVWRIMRTINKRSNSMAQKLVQHKLIDEGHKHNFNIGALWRTCLLQKECKVGRNVLYDIDTKDSSLVNKLNLFITRQGGEILEQVETPNGYHIVTNCFDNRLVIEYINQLNGDKDIVEVKKDAYIFVERYEV